MLGLEGDQFDMRRIKLGLEGRDEDLERYNRMLGNMAELGLRLLCYNFMATIGWCRTDVKVPTRGGALTSRFRLAELDPVPVPESEQIDEVRLWDNYRYFLRAVLPTAGRAGVAMGLHPDDPPVTPLRGIGRIFVTADAMGRAMELSDLPAHGMTFCQATFAAMGSDVPAAIRRFGKRIKFVHFRDVAGSATDFTETFHDEGPSDMPALIREYHRMGFRGPIRVDHVPSLAGEENLPHGYAHLGRLFAVGYLKGILDASGIACS
jgi:mannonate dehydratase